MNESSLGRSLVIGIVNNASDRALVSTESQFTRLLRSATREFDVRFRVFVCPETRRSGHPKTAFYRDIGELVSSWADALIIAGMEPQTPQIEDRATNDPLSGR